MASQCLIDSGKDSFKAVLYSLVFSAFMTLSACGGGGGGGSGNNTSDTNTNLNTAVTNGGTISEGSTPVTANAGTHDFVVTGLTASSLYMVWVHDQSAQVSLTTYLDSTHMISSCVTNTSSSTDECTTAAATNDNVYLRISSSTNATYTITVRPMPQSQGTSGNPVTITAGTPYNGQVGVMDSYYVINGLTPGAVYNISMNSILIDADLKVSIHKSLAASCTSINSGTAAETCTVPANFQGKIYIVAQSSGFGAYFTLNATPTGNTDEIFEGYSDEPVNLTGQLPYTGQVNYHDSHYMFTGLTPGVRYEVRILNSTVNTQVSLFDTSDYVNVDCDLNYSFQNPPPSRRLCVATAPASGSLYLQIPYFQTAGGTYQIDLGLAPVAEGNSTTPKTVSLASMPYAGQVNNTYSYYVITGLTPNYVYDIELNNPTHSYTEYTVESSLSALLNSTSCGSPCAIRSNGSGEIYVRVNGSSTGIFGSWFTLAFGNAENSEGTAAVPVVIPSNGSVYAGQVTEIPSYYKATGLTPNQYYLVYMTSEVYTGPYLYAYASNAYSLNICSNYPRTACLAPANASGELFIRVDHNSVYGARFNMWINPSLIVSEGSLALPISVSLNSNRASKVSSYNTSNNSYYVVTGLPATTNYTVSLTNLTDDAYVEVYSDAALANMLCASNHLGIDNESCVARTASGGGSKSLYIRVTMDKIRNYTDAIWDGANFTLNVTQAGTNIVSEGAIGAPVDITSSISVNNPAMVYSGMVRENGDSYYRITGLDPSTSYAVMLNYTEGNLGFRILADINFTPTNFLCVSNNTNDFSEHCTSTPNGSGDMYIWVEGNMYSDSQFTIGLKAAPVFEGSLLSPLDISTNLPYSGQVGLYNSSDNTTKSYYKVSGLFPNTNYIVTTSDTTQNAYTAVNGSNYCFNNGWSPAESCVITSNTYGEIALTVNAYESAFFTLNVRPAPVSEGSSSSPVALSLQTPYQGSRGTTDSYYKVTGLVPYSHHRISMTSQDDDPWMKIYTDGTYRYEVCYSGYDNHDIGCGATANAAGEIYFITGYTSSYYELYVP